MTLQQQAIKAVEPLSDENLRQVIQFINFLNYSANHSAASLPTKRKRQPGGFSGTVEMSDDFFETPDCFKEYI